MQLSVTAAEAHWVYITAAKPGTRKQWSLNVCVCVCVCAHACVRACMRVCVV